MNATQPSAGSSPNPGTNSTSSPLNSAVIATGLLSWVAISIGFLGLKILMQERPEFVGQPMRVARAELVQESPRIVVRKVSDDIAVVKPAQPDSAEVRFDMSGRRDYRGLRTIMDMSGEFHARYVLTNSFEEPVFVLFRCPHPRTESPGGGSILAGGLRLQSSVVGVQENDSDAWLWSGTLPSHGAANIEISYQVGSLKGVTYRVPGQDGGLVKQLRVTFHRRDIASMRFESGDGARSSADETVVWERRDFLAPDFFSAAIVENRNLHGSLSQLLEIGPLVSLLFLLAVSSVILARQPMTAVQMLTIAAGYALYFPLILYLSVRFSFPVALVIASAVPGALLVNYARWLVGGGRGLLGGPVCLALYWVFPTLAAFAGWNRGLVLLCLGVVTLWVLINLQNAALRRGAAVALFTALFLCAGTGGAAEVQVVIPAELAGKLSAAKPEPVAALLSIEPVQYQVRQESNHFRVEVRVAFQALRVGDHAVQLFSLPVHVAEARVESGGTNLASFVNDDGNRLCLFVQRTGAGKLILVYRASIENREGKLRAVIPLIGRVAGTVRLESARSDFEILGGIVWSKTNMEQTASYEIGVVAGGDSVVLEWRESGGPPTEAGKSGTGAKEFYGIGLTRAQHLTVVSSDGSCTHFAEFELPAFQSEEFRMKLPAGARLISASVNGNEISSPVVEDQMCRVRLPGREAQQTAHRLSFRIASPPVRLGFLGTVELALPEVFQTTGTMEWVVALPGGFDTQVITSGLEKQKSAPDLERFGDYGRILKSRANTCLAKELAPPGTVGLSLKYRQAVAGFAAARTE